MLVNSSSFADVSVLSPDHSSANSSLHPLMNTCFSSKMSITLFSAFSVANLLLLLPLFILVYYLAYKQWSKQRYISPVAPMNHCDLFIYHSMAMQLNAFLGFTLFFCGGYVSLQEMMVAGLYVWSFTSLGQALFHLLTCVERYLAFVHPISYLGLRQVGRVRIKKISAGCVWLLCFGWMAVLYLHCYRLVLILYLSLMVFFLIVISFCSISVLWALRRQGPGEVGGNRRRVDQSKQRAFNTILVVMGVLLYRFVGNLIGNLLYSLPLWRPAGICMVFSSFWFDLPSSLVLPLLFLHRAGKLKCRKKNIRS